MPSKEVLSALAIALTLASFCPYFLSIFRGNTKPHVFSWTIWGAGTLVVFLAQLEAGAGVGAWPIGLSGCLTTLVAVLAYLKRADLSITRTDWLFFGVAVTSLPFWYVTADPTWAVLILTVVDLLGFGPTFRKVYYDPHSESLWLYGLGVVRNLLVVFAVERYSLVAVLFPAAVGVACLLFVLFTLFQRRRAVATRARSGLVRRRTSMGPWHEPEVRWQHEDSMPGETRLCPSRMNGWR